MSSKMYQLINPGLSGPSEKTISQSTDWTKYIVCQTVTDERLQCPADMKRSDIDWDIPSLNII